ncbi:MAG: hypothetical protein N2Z69_03760 [Methylophilaceae bacterium]|nr:hypothetical protein [Methylophilaceae bacterium]
MNRRFLLFLFFLSPWFAGMCLAANWREVGSFPDTGVRVLVDDGSLSIDHDVIVKGWVRIEYMAPRERDGLLLSAYSSQRMAHCENGRFWVGEGWGMVPDKAEPVRIYATSQEWRLPAPDSEDEIAYHALCYEARSLWGRVWDKIKQGLTRMGEGSSE